LRQTTQTDSGAASHMMQVRNTAPKIRWHIECYHATNNGGGGGPGGGGPTTHTTFEADETYPIFVRATSSSRTQVLIDVFSVNLALTLRSFGTTSAARRTCPRHRSRG
jgi:hypothetical protein